MNTRSDAMLSPHERLFSLDFFRGFTMFLLIAEGTGFFHHLVAPQLEGTIIHFIGNQLHHHPWNGLHFWDLIQPFFMFIVGVAMPFSFANRKRRGDSYPLIRTHAVKRALFLLFIGWALYCIGPGRITFRFQNVLAQLSVTYIIAFFMMQKRPRTQIIVSVSLLALTEILYRAFPIAGFDQPFVPGHGFGAWFDLTMFGEASSGHWASFNAIPTTAHTMWGVLAGQVLMNKETTTIKKIQTIVIAGLAGLIIGYGLNPITPIIKKICTSSFIFASGGWSLLVLALSYWLIDVKKFSKGVTFFAIVGMNPLFIYLFGHLGGGKMMTSIPKPFVFGLLGWMGELPAELITSFLGWMLMWYICYWLYKRKLFIRI
jgi:predicted acyltransferase